MSRTDISRDEPPTFFRVNKALGTVEDFQPWDFEKAFLA